MNNTSEANSSVPETNTQSYYSFPAAFELPVVSCYIIIVTVGLVGNLMVCYAIMVDRNLRNNPTTLLLFSLALSDLLTVTLVAPFDMEVFFLRPVWVHGELMCEIWTVMFVTTVPTSIWTLLAISVDRYKSLSDPMNRYRRSPFLTRKRALIINLLIWFYSVLFASIPSMGWRDFPGEPLIYEGVCWFPYTRAYASLTSFLNFILPLLITCGIYIKIYRIVCGRNKKLRRQNLAFIEENKAYLGNLQAAKTISMFVGVFFFCWVPYSTYIVMMSLCNLCWKVIPEETYPLLLMFGYLNSALNPFLFALRNKSFKTTYSKIFSSSLRKLRPKVGARRNSTLSELAFASEIPDSTDSAITLQSIKVRREELRTDEAVVQDVSV